MTLTYEYTKFKKFSTSALAGSRPPAKMEGNALKIQDACENPILHLRDVHDVPSLSH